jgi:phage shock protein A
MPIPVSWPDLRQRAEKALMEAQQCELSVAALDVLSLLDTIRDLEDELEQAWGEVARMEGEVEEGRFDLNELKAKVSELIVGFEKAKGGKVS